MLDFFTNLDWSSPMTIGIGVVVALGLGGYLWWAWSEKQGPFER